MTRGNYLLPALLFLVCACVPATAIAQTTITGDWDLTINSPQGARTTLV